MGPCCRGTWYVPTCMDVVFTSCLRRVYFVLLDFFLFFSVCMLTAVRYMTRILTLDVSRSLERVRQDMAVLTTCCCLRLRMQPVDVLTTLCIPGNILPQAWDAPRGMNAVVLETRARFQHLRDNQVRYVSTALSVVVYTSFHATSRMSFFLSGAPSVEEHAPHGWTTTCRRPVQGSCSSF